MHKFNQITAAIFKHLIETFPNPIILDTEKLRVKEELPPNSSGDTNDIGAVIKWLSSESYIRFGSEAGFGQRFSAVVLTAKGLEALNRVPDSLTPEITVGQRLKELTKTASEQTVKSLVMLALSR